MTAPRLYLAGPDVFLSNANEVFDEMEAKCLAAGFVGVRPTDGGLSQGIKGTNDEIAERIYLGNMDILRSCEGILANLQPFRTQMEPDSGTVFEVGAGVALGKVVHVYLQDSHLSHEEKIAKHFGVDKDADGMGWDKKHGYLVESFGQPLNLMIARSASVFENFDLALESMKKVLLPKARIAP